MLSSLEELISPDGLTLGEILEDKKEDFRSNIEEKLTIDEIIALGLSEKEKSVISYLLKGNTIREIAEQMGISHVMVLKHKKSIIKKWRKKKGYQK
jgi:DNA-binding NarL/FixJ family response regulator